MSSPEHGDLPCPLPPPGSGSARSVPHPEARPEPRGGVLVVLDGVPQGLRHVVGGLGHLVVLQESEEPGVGGPAAADGGLQSES